MNSINRIAFFILLLSTTLVAFSQQSAVILKGKVLDENGNHLPYAKIFETQIQTTTLSNQRGNFYLKVPSPSAKIRISYIGYITIDTTLNFKNNASDTIPITFRMIPSSKELDVVSISSAPYQQVFETTNLNILDYTFFGQNILLIVNSKENYQVRLLDQQEKILTKQNLNFKPISFIKDCLGILHIVAEDSLFPVIFDSEQFTFPDAIPILDYIEFIEPCVTSNENYFFLKYAANFNQTVEYISQRKIDDNYLFMRKINDEIKTQDVLNYATELNMNYAPNIMSEIYSAADVRASREKTQDEFFFNLVMTNATYAPLFKTTNAIYIFDHLADSCFVFSQNSEPIQQFSINYQLQKNWGKKLIVDEANEKIYVLNVTNGIYSLHEINLETGELKTSTELTKHTFPEKIRIKDGWIYYLYQEKENPGFRKLYRVRLQSN